MNPDPTTADLNWLAFCYLAAELPAAEAADFEHRLAQDQCAREALARAVELSQAVMAAEAESAVIARPVVAKAKEWNSRLSWMALGGLAAAACLLLWTGVVGPTWQSAQRSLRSTTQQQLAVAWTEARLEMDQWQATEFAPLAGPEDSDANDELLTAIAFSEGADETPAWLTTAVLLAQNRASAEGSGPGQRLEN